GLFILLNGRCILLWTGRLGTTNHRQDKQSQQHPSQHCPLLSHHDVLPEARVNRDKLSPLQRKPSRLARPASKAQQGISEGEHLRPVGGTLVQHRAAEPSGRVAQRLLGEVIDRAGAVDAGEYAHAEVADTAPHQLREGTEMYLAPVTAPEGSRQVEVTLAL